MVDTTRITTDPPPTGTGKPELVSWLDRLQRNISTETDRLADIQDQLIDLAAVNGIRVTYLWSDLVVGDPLTGNVRGDDIQLLNNTEIVISDVDAFDRDLQPVLLISPLIQPEVLSLADANRSAEVIYEINGQPVHTPGSPGWTSIPVVVTAGSGGNPQAGDVVELHFVWTPRT